MNKPLTPAQKSHLRQLLAQEESARKYPESFSAGRVFGGKGKYFRADTVRCLIRQDLIQEKLEYGCLRVAYLTDEGRRAARG